LLGLVVVVSALRIGSLLAFRSGFKIPSGIQDSRGERNLR
jgi:hypothetical protein